MGYGAHRVQNSCGGGCRLANAVSRTKFEVNTDLPVPIIKNAHQFSYRYSVYNKRNYHLA